MDKVEFLHMVYTDFCDKHNLPFESADDLLITGHALTEYQKNWLKQFIKVWEE